MVDHLIAVETYGSQRVAHPHTRKTVSAYKLGYTSAVTAVLLALYGENAQDVSSKQATYRYVQIDAETVVRHGHILLTLTDEELALTERITKSSHRAGVFLWKGKQWWEFPNNRQPEYVPAQRSGLDFDPTGFRPPSPSSGVRESVVEGVFAERSQREEGSRAWWWLTGDTYPHRDLLKRYGARFSGKRKAWYWVGDPLPAAIQALVIDKPAEDVAPPKPLPQTPVMSPELERQILAVLGEDDAREQAERTLIEPDKPPAIRVSKPTPFPVDGTLDAVQTAIHEVKSTPPALHTAQAPSGKLARIGQIYCGELTGSITGQVYCYGYAVHEGVAVYLNMAGPRMAVEAIRAKLSKGDHVTLVPPDAPSIELSAGEGNTGMYHAYLHYLPEARFASLILVHDAVITPNYGGKATTFIFRTSDRQATAKLKHHVTNVVNVPVFEDWAGYLYDAGQRAMLIRKTRSAGGIDLISVDLDIDAWTRLITGGLEQGVIRLPQ